MRNRQKIGPTTKVLLWCTSLYLVATIAFGIFLGQATTHLPKDSSLQETAFRSRIAHQFHAHVRDIKVTAADNAVLQAWYVQPPDPNGKTVILLHGITSNRTSIAGFGDVFLRNGYSILVPDSREHGTSGGSIATYGVLEREDVHRWAQWLHQRSPGCVYLLGESMGAAIGLQASEITPELCAVAVESPYATFREISFERLGRATDLGTFFWQTLGRPAIEVAILSTKIRYGIYLPDAEPKSAVERSTVPTLLIAGTADRDIPMHNAQELAVDCPNHCSLWIVPGAGHGGAAVIDKSGFNRRVLDWFAQHTQPGGLTLAASI